MKRILTKISIFTLITLSAINFLDGSILDTPEANLTQAQKEWLLDNRQNAKKLYIAEIDTAKRKEVPAYNAAFLCYDEHDYALANKYLKTALRANPKYGPALLLKATIEYGRHNLTNSFNCLLNAIKYHPFPEIPNFHFGKYLYERKKYGEAIKYLKKAISVNKLYTFPYPILGDIYIQLGEIDKAVNILEKGLKYSFDAEIIFQLACAYKLSGRIDDAIKLFDFFIYLYPQHPFTNEARKYLADQHENNLYTNGFEPIPERGESSRFFPIGENQVYSVYLGIIRVGELNTEIIESLNYNGNDAYKVRFSLDSNPVLEFAATLHSDYITIIDQRTKQVYRHFLHLRENNVIAEKVYDYLRDEGKFKCRIVHEDGHINEMEKFLPKNAIDGTSILFYSRQVVFERRSEMILTTIDENFVITEIVFNNVKEPVTVRENDEMALLISGENHYKGIVGLTGRFRGWFRDDPTYIPLGSDFEIWVGRIRIVMATEEEQRLHKFAR